VLDLLREQEKTSFPSRESSFSGWEQSAVSSTLTATIRVSDNFGSQTNVTSSCSIALQTNLRNGLFVSNNPVNLWDPMGLCEEIPWWNLKRKLERAEEIAKEELSEHRGHNDSDDAQRHSEWSKRMSEELGEGISDIVGTGHELEGLLKGQPVKEAIMDLNNNKEGRNAARERREVNKDNLRTGPNKNNGVGGPYGY
jgi:hypothetical protein